MPIGASVRRCVVSKESDPREIRTCVRDVWSRIQIALLPISHFDALFVLSVSPLDPHSHALSVLSRMGQSYGGAQFFSLRIAKRTGLWVGVVDKACDLDVIIGSVRTTSAVIKCFNMANPNISMPGLTHALECPWSIR